MVGSRHPCTWLLYYTIFAIHEPPKEWVRGIVEPESEEECQRRLWADAAELSAG